MACYLLIHGNRHGKWAWTQVVDLLQWDGHDVHAIDLPGHGDDATPRHTVTLQHIRKAVLNYVNHRQLEHIILVGHSSGGMVLAAIANDLEERLTAMVFVAAIVPRTGESQLSDMPHQQQEAYRQLANSRPDYSIPVSYKAARERYFNDLSAMAAQTYFQKLTPEPFGVMESIVTHGGWEGIDVPTAYVICTKDQALSSELCHRYAQRLNNPSIFEVEAGHDAMLSQPQQLVKILEKVALIRSE